MKIGTKLLAVVLASVLIGTIAVNQVYAPRNCGQCAPCPECVEFKKLTHEFEKGVIAAIEDPENIPEALNAYSLNVQRIFSGDPNIDRLLQTYEQDIITLFDTREPIPGNQLVKEFRSLTHHYEKAVIDAFTGPED